MPPTTLVHFVNVFSAVSLAALVLVIRSGLRPPAEILDEQSHLQFRQTLVLRLRVLVPAFFVPAAVLGIALTVLGSAAPGFGFRCAGVVALLTWIVIRVIGTVPINSATLTWQPSAPPKNWKAQVNTRSASILLGSGRRSWHLRSS